MSEPEYSPEEFENTIFQTVATTQATRVSGVATTVFPTYVPPEAGGGEAQAVSFEGRRFRQYRLKKQLGEGGQGVVWLAQDELLEKPVALKFLPLAVSANQDAMERMKQEAQVLLELTHERIVRLNTLETEGDAAFLVMEYLPGPDLGDIVEERIAAGERGLSVDEALWVLDQLAEPLDYANGKGITHRDIKPANVMLTEVVDGPLHESSATAKLCDFGIAFVTTTSMNELTGYVPVGTLAFIAPEVLMGRLPTPAADIYSMAASLYYMVAGKPVFPADNIVGHIGSSTPRPLDSGDADFDAAIARALSKDPEERPGSALELLREASGGRLGNTATVVIKRSLRAIVATAAIVALLAGGVYALRNIFGLKVEIEMTDMTNRDVEPARIKVNRDEETTLLLSFDEQGEESYETAVTDVSGVLDMQLTLSRLDEREHTLHVRNAKGEVRQSHVFTIDRTAPHPTVAELRAPPYREDGNPVHDADQPVIAVFEFEEPAQLFLAGREDDPLTSEYTTDHGEIVLPPPPSARAEVRYHTYHVRARDRLGNVKACDLDLAYFSLERLVTRLRAEYPLKQIGGWDSRDWDALYVACADWRATVGSHARLSRELKKELLEDAAFQNRFAQLERLHAGRPSLVSVEKAVPTDDGDFVIHTPKTDLRLSGRIENPRAGVVALDGDLQGEAPVEADGTFVFRLTLNPNRVHGLRLSHERFFEPHVVRVVHDDRRPAIRIPEGRKTLEVARDPFDLAIEMLEPNAESVTASGVAFHLEGPSDETGWRTWTAAGVSLAGQRRGNVEIEARDRAGNVERLPVSVVLDDTPPELGSVSPGSENRETRAAFPLRLEFDEPATGVLEATFQREGRSQPVPLEGVVSDGRVWTGTVAPPDEDGEIVVSVRPRDHLGNELDTPRELRWKLVRSPWGDIPPGEREGMAIVDDERLEDGVRRFPRRVRHEQTGIDFVYVPGGAFELGSPAHEKGRPNEGPARPITMTGFYVARTEMSWGQWQRGGGVLRDGVDREEEGWADLPVTVERGHAIDWCERNGFELPSEAQWEYAASGPENRTFPWGAVWSSDEDRANHKPALGVANPRFEPVDSRPDGQSWCGALNMAGNVWEWCRDSLGSGETEFRVPSSTDPVGNLADGALRGGSAHSSSEKCRTAYRHHHTTGFFPYYGVRPIWRPLASR